MICCAVLCRALNEEMNEYQELRRYYVAASSRFHSLHMQLLKLLNK